MEDLLLTDIWRDRNAETRRYSWYRKSKFNSGKTPTSRIDYALISAGISDIVHNVMYIAEVESDHSAFFLGLEPHNLERGPGYWKLNTKYLSDKDYISELNNLIDMRLQIYSSLSARERWDLLKEDIKRSTIMYAKR